MPRIAQDGPDLIAFAQANPMPVIRISVFMKQDELGLKILIPTSFELYYFEITLFRKTKTFPVVAQ